MTTSDGAVNHTIFVRPDSTGSASAESTGSTTSAKKKKKNKNKKKNKKNKSKASNAEELETSDTCPPGTAASSSSSSSPDAANAADAAETTSLDSSVESVSKWVMVDNGITGAADNCCDTISPKNEAESGPVDTPISITAIDITKETVAGDNSRPLLTPSFFRYRCLRWGFDDLISCGF